MEDPSITLDVSILGREYRVACRESERDELMQAVQFVDRRMREIRDSGKISGTERIAVMAGLNIAHELLRAKSGNKTGCRRSRGTYEASKIEQQPGLRPIANASALQEGVPRLCRASLILNRSSRGSPARAIRRFRVGSAHRPVESTATC